MKKIAASLILSIFVSLSFANAQALQSVKVGFIFPLSGDFGQYGSGAANAIKLAAKQNENYILEPFFEDNRTCAAPEAVTAYKKLVAINRIQVVVTFCTAAAKAIAPITKAEGITLFQLTDPGEVDDTYMIKMMPDSAPFIDVLANTFITKYKRMAILANSMEVNTSKNGNVPRFKQAYEQLGGAIVFSEEFSSETNDFKTLITKLRASKAEAVIPFIWDPKQLATFLKQSDQLNLWTHMKLAGNFVFELMLRDIAALYPRILTLEGLESVNFKNTTSPAFKASFQSEFKQEPPQFADYAYDVAAMIQRCGVDKKCLQQRFEGASGFTEFDQNNRRKGTFVRKQLSAGQFVQID